jgi:biotin carboxyl carrier protein
VGSRGGVGGLGRVEGGRIVERPRRRTPLILGTGRSRSRRRPVAAMTQGVRVAPTLACLLPSDRPIVVAPDDPGETFVEPYKDGRVVVHGADGSDRWAHLAPGRRLADGRTVVEVVVDGWRFELEVEDDARARLRERATRVADATATTGPLEVRAAIPGRVAAVAVAAGDAVEVGQTLLVVEAMKMQNELRATRAGQIERVTAGVGDTIELGDLLVVMS